MSHSHGESFIAQTEGHTIHSWARYYDLVLGVLSLGREKKFRRAALDLVSIEPGMGILDVGCGTGSLAVAAKQKQGSEGTVVGIDPSSNMIDFALKKADKAGLDIDFRVGVIEDLEFDDDKFDLVLSSSDDASPDRWFKGNWSAGNPACFETRRHAPDYRIGSWSIQSRNNRAWSFYTVIC